MFVHVGNSVKYCLNFWDYQPIWRQWMMRRCHATERPFYRVFLPDFTLRRLQIPPKTTSRNTPHSDNEKAASPRLEIRLSLLALLMVRQLPLGPMDIARSAASIPAHTAQARHRWPFLRFAGGGGPFPAPAHPTRPEPRTTPSRAELLPRMSKHPLQASQHQARRRPPPRAPPAIRGSSGGSYPPWHGQLSTAQQPTGHPHWQTSRQRYAAGNGN